MLARILVGGFLLAISKFTVSVDASPLTATVWADEPYQVYVSTSEILDGSLFLEGNGGSDGPQSSETPLVKGVTNYLHVRVKNDGGDGCAWIGTFSVGDTHIFSDVNRTISTGSVYWRMSRIGFGPPYDFFKNFGLNGTAPWGTQAGVESNAAYMGANDGPGDYYFSLAISPTNIDTPGSRYEYVIYPESDTQEGGQKKVIGLPQVALLENGANRAMSVSDPGRAGVRVEDSVDAATGDEYTFVEAESELFDFVFTGPGNESTVDISLNLRLKGSLKAGAGNSNLGVETSEASTLAIFTVRVNRVNFFSGEATYEARHTSGGENPGSDVSSTIFGFLQPLLPSKPGGDAGDFVSEFNLDIDQTLTTPVYTVPTGEPIRVSLEMQGITTATSDGGRAIADIQFTGGLHFPYEGPVFNLPDGFTVNALSAGVVDNRFETGGSGDPDKVLVPGLFMRAGDIAGESRSEGHEDWTDLLEVSSGLFRMAQGRNRQPAIHEDVGVTKHVDKSSPKLAEALTRGTILEKVIIEHTRQLSQELWAQFEFHLQNVLVTHYQILGQGADPVPLESFFLNYEKIDWIYRLCDLAGVEQGRVEANWDLVTNSGGSSSTSGENEPPSMDPIGNQSVSLASTASIDLVIADGETDEEDLAVTVSTSRPDLIGDLQVTGSGANRNLSFKTSALFSGFASVVVTVSDGVDSRSSAIPVLIDVEMTPYEGYLAAYFGEDELDNPQLVSPILDPDKDNIPTVIEFLLGTNPREHNRTSEAVSTTVLSTPSNRTVEVNFRRRLGDPNVQGYLWGSSDMKTWQRLDSSNPIYEESSTGGQNPLFEEVEGVVTLPAGSDPFFLRYQVTDVF